MTNYPIVTKTVPTFYFVGVTTGKSSIMKVFPRWMEAWGRPDVIIEGIDHAIHDDPENYRATVAQIKYDTARFFGQQLLEALLNLFACCRCELAKPDVADTTLQHLYLGDLYVKVGAGHCDLKGLWLTFSLNQKRHIRAGRAAHQSDGFIEG